MHTKKILLCMLMSFHSSCIYSLEQALNQLTHSFDQLRTMLTGAQVRTVANMPYAQKKVGDPIKTDIEKKRVLFDPFKYVMGLSSEDALMKLINTHPEDRGPLYTMSQSGPYAGSYLLINQENKQRFLAGKFHELSIGDLRKQSNTGAGCKFSVVEAVDKPYDDGNGNPQWFRSFVDTPALQAEPANKDAVFQVASNFNALEAGGGLGIGAYMSTGMYVQGEAASLSAMPAAIWRMYFGVRDDNDNPFYQGFKNREINFLSDITEIKISHGYPAQVMYDAFKNMSEQERDAYIQKVRIGFHENVQVTSGLGPLKSPKDLTGEQMRAVVLPNNADMNKNQVVNQVFTAAFNGGSKQQEPVARMLLRAAYEGTIKSTVAYGKKKLFLTLIGGGVFHNKLPWIQDAIEHALQWCLNNGSLDITLIVYDTSGFQTPEVAAFRQSLFNYVHAMGGTYTQYKTDGTYELVTQK